MWRKFLQWVMNNRPTRVIMEGGIPLFFRAFLFRIGPWRLYLHHFKISDPDRGLHDHPSWNVAWVMAGGYFEQRFVGFEEHSIRTKWKRVWPGMFNVVSHNCFHRVVLKEGMRTSWSLFLVNYKKAKGKRWGFLRKAGDTSGGVLATYTMADPPNDGDWWTTALKGCYLDPDTGGIIQRR